jgi:hypothetical protein
VSRQTGKFEVLEDGLHGPLHVVMLHQQSGFQLAKNVKSIGAIQHGKVEHHVHY